MHHKDCAWGICVAVQSAALKRKTDQGSMKAEPGDVVQEKLTGKGIVGRVITTDPARKLAMIQLPYKVHILADHEYDVVFRRGVQLAESTPRRSSPSRRGPLLPQPSETQPAVQALPKIEAELEQLPDLEPVLE